MPCSMQQQVQGVAPAAGQRQHRIPLADLEHLHIQLISVSVAGESASAASMTDHFKWVVAGLRGGQGW